MTITEKRKQKILLELHKTLQANFKEIDPIYPVFVARSIGVEFLAQLEADEIDYDKYPDESSNEPAVRNDTEIMLNRMRDKIDSERSTKTMWGQKWSYRNAGQ